MLCSQWAAEKKNYLYMNMYVYYLRNLLENFPLWITENMLKIESWNNGDVFSISHGGQFSLENSIIQGTQTELAK